MSFFAYSLHASDRPNWRGNWKLIDFFETGKPDLYDLSSDPSEIKDLVGTNTEKTNILLKALHEWQKETRAAIPFGTNPNYDPNAKKRPREDRKSLPAKGHF